MTTLDFELEIGSRVAGSYPVMARAPGGEEATATLRLPLNLPELDHQLTEIRDAVLGATLAGSGAPAADERSVRKLGQQLFEALVTDEVRSLYVTSSQHARQQGSVLRMGLRVRAAELVRLPWEFLF